MTSATIQPVAMTAAQIAAQTTPSLYVAIATVTTADNVIYKFSTDSYCAVRIQSPFPDIIDNVTTGDVTIGGRLINSQNTLYTIDSLGATAGFKTSSLGVPIASIFATSVSELIVSAGLNVLQHNRPVVVSESPISSLIKQNNSVAIMGDTTSLYYTASFIELTFNSTLRSDGFRNGSISGSVNSIMSGAYVLTVPFSSLGITSVVNLNQGSASSDSGGTGLNVSGRCFITNTSGGYLQISGFNTAGFAVTVGFSLIFSYT